MAMAVVLVLLVIGSLIFHFASPWWFTPIASNWTTMDDTVVLTFWVTGIVFVAVNLFLAWVVWRYRHRDKQVATYDPENKKLEWWLTAVTSVGVAAMLAPGLFVWGKFVNVPKDAAIVEAIGQQWHWSFRFPGADGELGHSDARSSTPDNPFGLDPDDPKGRDDVLVASPELHLPVDQPVKVLLRSKDVLHNFTVTQFRVKMDLVPGMITHLWLTPTVPGSYEILCEELCGVGHFAMRGRVVVTKRDEFDTWLAAMPTYSQTQALAKADPGAGAGAVRRLHRLPRRVGRGQSGAERAAARGAGGLVHRRQLHTSGTACAARTRATPTARRCAHSRRCFRTTWRSATSRPTSSRCRAARIRPASTATWIAAGACTRPAPPAMAARARASGRSTRRGSPTCRTGIWSGSSRISSTASAEPTARTTTAGRWRRWPDSLKDERSINDVVAYINTLESEDELMAYVAIADRDAPIHDPHTFIEKYIWSQDHKVIAIQYAIVAIFVGLVALVLSGLMRLQLGFPEHVPLRRPEPLLPVHHHARDDHGDLPADGALPRRIRQLPDPAHGAARGTWCSRT